MEALKFLVSVFCQTKYVPNGPNSIYRLYNCSEMSISLFKYSDVSMCCLEISCAAWSAAAAEGRGRSLRRLHADAAAGVARQACVSPCALVLALLYLERLNACNKDYLANMHPQDLFLVSLVTLPTTHLL